MGKGCENCDTISEKVLRKMSMSRLVLCFLAAMPSLVAHDLYILPGTFQVAPGQKLRVAYHNGDAFPESEAAPPLARLTAARLVSRWGSVSVGELHAGGKEVLGEVVVPKGGSFQLAVATTPNFIELEPAKFVDYLQEEGLDEVIAWRRTHGEDFRPGRERYSKFAKSVLRGATDDDFYQAVLGLPIEIVLLSDPGKLKAGDKLRVKVLLRGKPAVGLQLEATRALGGKAKTTAIGRTGADGGIDVPIDQAGRWRLHGVRMERCAEPKLADWESLWASVTFEVR